MAHPPNPHPYLRYFSSPHTLTVGVNVESTPRHTATFGSYRVGSSKYYEMRERFLFVVVEKVMLPLHFAVCIAEVGCKKSAAANCETVFCAAGKFTEEAKSCTVGID